MNPMHIPITATSAPLAGFISDTTGSYNGVFWLYGGCCALAAIGLTIMGSVLRSPDHQQAIVTSALSHQEGSR